MRKTFFQRFFVSLRDSKISKNFYLLLLLLVSIVAVTFSWFIISKQSKTEAIDATSIKAMNSKISFEKAGEYADEIEKDESISLVEISGLGYADEEGKLPMDLKRGVLSEDGIYDLLTDYQRLKELHI